jgi:UDP-N-acetylmuramoyl-tripeptide--D-alanyl-D-alanine ligase
MRFWRLRSVRNWAWDGSAVQGRPGRLPTGQNADAILGSGGVRVLDDAYNANADSTVAALETLCDLPLQGRRVAVLGDMAELGAHSEAAHAEVGRRAAELGIGQLFAVGKMAPVMAAAARGRRVESGD